MLRAIDFQKPYKFPPVEKCSFFNLKKKIKKKIQEDKKKKTKNLKY